jgi:hypothetical protein
MKLSVLVLMSIMSLSALAMSPAVKPAVPNAPTDPLYQESADQTHGAIVDKKATADKKKFKPKQTLEKDEKEAELLEQKDESAAD